MLTKSHNEIEQAILLAKRTTKVKTTKQIKKQRIKKSHTYTTTNHSNGSVTTEEKIEEIIEREITQSIKEITNEDSLKKFNSGFVEVGNNYLKTIEDKNSLTYSPIASYTLETPQGQELTYELLELPSTALGDNYLERREQALEDFTNLVPDKVADIRPLPRGLYGFTYLNTNYMAISSIISHEQQRETMVHEAIHTQDEYETRILTWWMMAKDQKYAVRITKNHHENSKH
jgi:hypothetical protein